MPSSSHHAARTVLLRLEPDVHIVEVAREDGLAVLGAHVLLGITVQHARAPAPVLPGHEGTDRGHQHGEHQVLLAGEGGRGGGGGGGGGGGEGEGRGGGGGGRGGGGGKVMKEKKYNLKPWPNGTPN